MKKGKRFAVWLSENLFWVGVITAIIPVIIMVILYLLFPGPSEEVRKERGDYTITPPMLHEVGEDLIGPIIYTVDARSMEEFRYFDFSRGSVVDIDIDEVDRSLDWDLGFHRVDIMVNGGDRRKGNGGVIDMGEVEFESVVSAPESGYKERFDRWFNYDTFSHNITSRKDIYIIRTADNRYVKMRILSYYCKGIEDGCITFEYVYQGDGSRNFQKRELSQ